MKFEARMDTWIKVYFGAVLAYFGLLVVLFVADGLYTLIVLPLIIGAILIDVWVRASYRFTESHLLIRSGIFYIKINYDEIESVKYKKGIMRGFALSSKQLVIKLRNKGNILGKYYVSPKNRERFIEELKKYSKFTESEV